MDSPKNVVIDESVDQIEGWPTDTCRIKFVDDSAQGNPSPATVAVHTVLIFVPGNPGCVGWYIPILATLVSNLGPGYASFGVSYAGHGTTDDIVNVERWIGSKERDTSVPWSLNGQIRHKISAVEMFLAEIESANQNIAKESVAVKPQIVFLSHSIGSFMVQQVCLRRHDILQRTALMVHLMPFVRMNAPWREHMILTTGAKMPRTLIGVGKLMMGVLKRLPYFMVDQMMRSSLDDDAGRELAVKLIRSPAFARNFFELGTEEIRTLPRDIDTEALCLIGCHCPISMLYCGEDKWAPEFHQDNLQLKQTQLAIPQNAPQTMGYMPEVRHDFVSYSADVPKVTNWILAQIRSHIKNSRPLRSRL